MAGTLGHKEGFSDDLEKALAGVFQTSTPKGMFSSRLETSLANVKPIDVEDARRLRQRLEAIRESKPTGYIEECQDITSQLRGNVSCGLRVEVRQRIAELLDDGKIVVLVTPSGFGKTSVMKQFFRDVGGGTMLFLYSSKNIRSSLGYHTDEIREHPTVFLDEFSELPIDSVVNAAKALHQRGKGVVLAVRPYGYHKTEWERAFNSDPLFSELHFSALSVGDEKRIVDGFGLDEESGGRLMTLAEGLPVEYNMLFRGNVLCSTKDILRYLDDMDSMERDIQPGNRYYGLDTSKYRESPYYSELYKGTLSAVKALIEGEEITPEQRKLALGSGLALEREARIYVPKAVKIIANFYPGSLTET